MPILALGRNKFEIDGLNFQEMDRETTVKWPAISRFGRRPGRQMTGFGEDTVIITGLLYPEDVGGREQLDALRATQQAAQPVMMVGWSMSQANAARIYGRVVILSIRDRHSKFGVNGNSQKIQFDVEVAPPGDDDAPQAGWF